MESYQGKAISSERRRLSIPQVYVQLQFGVSWTPRHTPQNHTMAYMSKSLRNSTDFPRQVGQPATKLITRPDGGHARSKETNTHHYQQHHGRSHSTQNPHKQRNPEERRREREGESSRHHANPQTRRQSRHDGREAVHERGTSAPPLSHNNPWLNNADTMTSALPGPARGSRHPPAQVWKALPAAPSQFRLGSDGLPWSSWAYPEGYAGTEDGEDIADELVAYRNNPTTVELSPTGRLERRHSDDPARIQELENLSMAMMTVDNGFENQWWYQGQRETTEWIVQGAEDHEAVYSPHSDPGDRRVVSALEQTPTSGRGWSGSFDKNNSARMIVSPISENSMSPGQSFRPLQRSLTTHSVELFIGM